HIERAAAALHVEVNRIAVRQVADLDTAFKRGNESGTHAYIVTTGPLFNLHRQAIAERLVRSKTPSMFSHTTYAEAGGLLSYSPSYEDNYRRVATHVDKILKGAKPADLPIETPNK